MQAKYSAMFEFFTFPVIAVDKEAFLFSKKVCSAVLSGIFDFFTFPRTVVDKRAFLFFRRLVCLAFCSSRS